MAIPSTSSGSSMMRLAPNVAFNRAMMEGNLCLLCHHANNDLTIIYVKLETGLVHRPHTCTRLTGSGSTTTSTSFLNPWTYTDAHDLAKPSYMEVLRGIINGCSGVNSGSRHYHHLRGNAAYETEGVAKAGDQVAYICLLLA